LYARGFALARRLLFIAGFAMFATGVFAQTEFSVTPDIVSAPLGQSTTFTTLLTVNSLPFEAPVTATITSGPNAGTPVNDDGNGVFSYTGSEIGTDTVEFSATVLSVPVTATAMVTWVDIQCGVQPDPAAAKVGDFVQLTATILRDGALQENVTVNYQVTAGPNQGKSGNSTTNASGRALIGYTSNGLVGTDSLTLSGSIDGVPFSCPATVSWLDLECHSDSIGAGLVNTPYRHTVTIFRDGEPVVGATVGFSIDGLNVGTTGSATTDSEGDARFTYTSTVPGTDTLIATAIVEGVTTACTTELEWSSSGCSISPNGAARQINTPHILTFTAFVEGSPLAGATVDVSRFGANGPLPAGTTITTDTQGVATFSYNGANIGEDILTFSVGGNICDAIVVWRDLQVSVAPASATLQVGSAHTLLATVTLDGEPAKGASLDLSIASGPNLTSTDTATTDANGQATLAYTSNGNAGIDTVAIQALHASVGNGTTASVDWKIGACQLTPATAIAGIGAQHSVDIEVTLGAVPQPGATVDFLVTDGPNAGASAQLTTDGSGRARFTYTGNGGIGIDSIEASSDIDGVTFSCNSSVEWIQVACFAIDTLHAPTGSFAHLLVEVSRNGQPVPGTVVNLEVLSGPNNASSPLSLTTGPGGDAYFRHTDPAATGGTDLLRASGSVDGVPFSCDISVHWQAIGATTLLPLVLQPTTGSTVAIPALVTNAGVPAPGTVTYDVVRGHNAGAAVPVPTQGAGLAVWSFTDDNLGLSHIHARSMLDGTPASGAAGVHWIDGPAAGFNPLFASRGTGEHSVTLSVEDNFEPVVGLSVNVGIPSGPNQGIGQQLVTDANGEITFTYTANGNPGFDLIIATAQFPAGTASWNAIVEWTAIDCNLSAPAFAQVGEPIDIQLDLQQQGAPVDGIDVDFTVFGINGGTSGQVSTTNGQATFSYTGGTATGLDTITASGSIQGAPFSCEIQVEWIDVQCDLLPTSSILPINQQAALEASVTRNGIPVPGLSVTVDGADDPGPARATISQTTDESGFFDIFVTSDQPEQRTVTISGQVDGLPFSCSSTVEWVELACTVAVSASPLNIGNAVTLTLEVTRNGVSVTPVNPEFEVISGPHIGLSVDSLTLNYTGADAGIDSIDARATVDGLPILCSATVDWREVSCQTVSSPGTLLQIGDTHSLDILVFEEGQAVAGVDVTLDIDSGPNAGFSDTATTNTSGVATFTWVGNSIGTDAFTASGSHGVPFTCSGSVEWAEFACTVDPDYQQVATGGQASFVYTLSKNGTPVSNAPLTWAVVDGPNSDIAARNGLQGSATTDAAGNATISYSDFAHQGATDTVRVNFSLDGVSLDCEALVEWMDYACDLQPQAATVNIGTEHVLTTVLTANGEPVANNAVTFAISAGPHLNTTATVSTDEHGVAIFAYTGTAAGTDSIDAFGTVNGGTFSCSTTATWEIGPLCTLSPSIAFANIAGEHTLTLALTDDGSPLAAAAINFSVIDGPNFGVTSNEATDASGNASFTISGSSLGTDTIVATGPSGAICSAAVTWIAPQCAIVLDPAVFGVGQTATIPVQISRNGSPAAGVTATLSVTDGPNADTNQTLVSDQNGDIFFSYTGGPNFGIDQLKLTGTIDGVEFTCTDALTWIDVACSVAPGDTYQQIGNDQTFTVTLTKNGAPVPGHPIDARRVPGNTSLGTLTTDETGSTSVTISSNTIGFDNVYFNAEIDGVPTECFGNVNWIDLSCGITAATTAQVGNDFNGTLLLQQNGEPVFEGDVSWSILSGPNAGAASLDSVTDSNGESTFSYTSILTGGTDIIQATGTVDGVPYTCTHSIEWVDIQCSLTPIAATMHTGQQQNIGISVTRNGVLVPGVAADFAIETGPHSGEFAEQIENFSFTGSVIGADRVVASGQYQGIDFSCDLEVSWITIEASVAAPNPKAQINADFPLTITVLKNGAPAPGVDVQLNAPARVANLTDASGQVTIPVASPTIGTQAFTFSGSIDGVPFSTSATVEFVDLQCSLSPAQAFYQIGEQATLDLTLTLNGQTLAAPAGTFLITSGPNTGQTDTGSSFSYTSDGNIGQDNIRVTGSHDGVDYSCDALVDFVDVQCSLAPATAVADADGSAHQVELTLTVNGTPAVGETADLSVQSGINTGFADSATTSAGGKVSFSISNNAGTFGTDNFEISGNIQGIPFKCPGGVRWLRTECSADPADADAVSGFDHNVTFTIFTDGAPAPDVTVDIGGPISQQLTTDTSGQVSVSWQGSGTETLSASGNISGVPFSCESVVRWVPNAECNFANAAGIVGIGQDVSLQLTLTQDGQNLAGHPVTFTVTDGPNAGATLDTSTDESGAASFSYNAGATIGTDTIVASSSFLGAPVTCQATREIIDVQCSFDHTPDHHVIGDSHTLTLSVTRNDVLVPDVTASYEVVDGPNLGQTATGTSFEHSSNGVAGTDTVLASGQVDGVDFSCEAIVHWIDYGCEHLPEFAIAEVGSTHQTTVTFTRDGVPAANQGVTFVVVSGPNNGFTFDSTTDAAGQASFSYSSATSGFDLIDGYTDLDGNSITCRAEVEWISVACNLAAAASPLALGNNASINGTLLRSAEGVSGIAVDFEVISGPHTGVTGNATTGDGGSVSFGYTGNQGFGTDIIEMRATVDGVATSCQTSQRWLDLSCEVSSSASEVQIGGTATLTCTVTLDGAPAGGLAISASTGDSGTTDAAGQFSLAVTDSNIGVKTVTFDSSSEGISTSCQGSVEFVDISCELTPSIVDLLVGDNSFANTATIRRNGVAVEGVDVSFGVTAGPNAGANASITTDASGQADFVYLGDGGVGIDNVEIAGSVNGIPFSCSATRSYRSLPECALSPDASSAQSGGTHSVTVTIVQDSAPYAGDVTFSITSGPNTGQSLATATDSSGNATFTYSSNGQAGSDTIEVAGSYLGQPFSCSTSQEWFDVFTCEVDPSHQVAKLDSDAPITVTLLRNGQPHPGGQINQQTTDENGQVTFTVTNNAIGTETYTFLGDGNSECNATVEWVDFQLLLTPQDQFHGVGDSATLNATISRNSTVVTGEQIDLSIDSGPNAGHSDSDTSIATFSYIGSGGNGTDQLRVSTTVEGVFLEAFAQVGWLDVKCQVLTPGSQGALGVEYTFQAQVTLNGAPAVGRRIGFNITDGPNGGQSHTANTDNQGIAEFAITGTAPGTDTIEVSGEISGVPYSCSETFEWLTPPECSVEPASAIVGLSSSHSVTVSYLANTAIRAEVVSGPNAGTSAELTTDANGHATFTYTGDGGIGEDSIEFFADFLGADVSCQASADWQSIDCQLVGGDAVVGRETTLTLTLLRNGTDPIPAAVANLAIDQGPNTPISVTLQTDATGQASFSYTGTGGIGQDVVTVMGEVDGIQFQCQAAVEWLSGIGCTFSPEHASATACETQPINLTVLNDGDPVAEVSVAVEVVNGPNTGFQTTLTTDAQGRASFELAGTGALGTDVIVATVTLNNVQETCQATREWTNSPPVISCPGDITCNSITPDGGTIWWDVFATDECDTPTITCTPTAGSQFPIGSTTVTCIATDSHGAQDSCTFTVTITDTIPDELLGGLSKINPDGPVRMDSPLVVDMQRAFYETAEVGDFFMGKSPLTVSQFIELANRLFARRAGLPRLRFTPAGDIFYGDDIQLFDMAANNNVHDPDGRELFDYGIRFGANGYYLNAPYIRVRLFGDATLPRNGGNPEIQPSGTECDELLAIANFPILGVSWYGGVYLANAYSRYAKGLESCDLAYAIGPNPEDWRPNHLSPAEFADGFDSSEQQAWVERFPFAYRLPTYDEYVIAGQNQSAGNYATHEGGNYFNSDDFFDNGPTPVGYYYRLDHNPINDLSGNVWEWLTAHSAARASDKGITGGSWFNSQSHGQVGQIFGADPNGAFSDVGLRFVATHDFRFRAYLREASQPSFDPPQEFDGHVYHPTLQPGSDYIWEAEFTHDALEGALGWMPETNGARAEASFSTTGQQPTTTQLSAVSGWNLMSVDIEPYLCHSKHLFGMDSTVWAWNPILQIYEYEPGAIIEPFKGYWVHFPSTVPTQIHGFEPLSTEILLRRSYNLIGPAQDEFPIERIENRLGPVYGYFNNAFHEAKVLRLGYAYFIFVARASVLELNPTAVAVPSE
jgi:formylglycine-generating enzyme required for sulfatase activity